MLHFYKGDKVKNILRAVFNALKRKGKFFISTGTPYWGVWKEKGFLKKFETEKQKGNPWPGFMKSVSFYTLESHYNVAPSMNFLDQEIARIHIEKAGFKIEKCFYFPRETYPQSLHLNGREGLGIIARKP